MCGVLDFIIITANADLVESLVIFSCSNMPASILNQ
jgi:hypothetical protein